MRGALIIRSTIYLFGDVLLARNYVRSFGHPGEVGIGPEIPSGGYFSFGRVFGRGGYIIRAKICLLGDARLNKILFMRGKVPRITPTIIRRIPLLDPLSIYLGMSC